MLKVLDSTNTMLYAFSMRRGPRYIGEVDGKRYWKAILCGHPVPMYQTKRCWDCWKPQMSKALTGRKISKVRTGSDHHSWKGGRVMHKASGYVLLRKPSHPHAQKAGYVFEHRIVMEQSLGRYLENDEEVHHINHDKSDNRLENLMLFSTHAEHIKYEHQNGERKFSE